MFPRDSSRAAASTGTLACVNLYARLFALLARLKFRRKVDFFARTGLGFRVWPTDLDAIGHMNNAKYLALLDLGRIDLWVRSGFWDLAWNRGWYGVVSAQSIRYRRSLKPWERFEVSTEVVGWDEKAIYYVHDFTVGDELCARAVVQSRTLTRSGGQVTPKELWDLVGGAPEMTLPDWVDRWAEDVRIGL